MLHLSYDAAQATTEEDHAAVHLINLLMEAQARHEAPLAVMDLPALRNAAKNREELDRLAEIFYRHDLLLADGDVLPFRVAGVLLPVAMAIVALEQQDHGGAVLAPEAMSQRLAVAIDGLCARMHPGFSVDRKGIVRPGHADAMTAQRLDIGLAIVAVMRDVYDEIETIGAHGLETDASLSQG